jgi:hypothetical protein
VDQLIEQFDDEIHDLVGKYLQKGCGLNLTEKEQREYAARLQRVMKTKSNLLLKMMIGT